MALNINSVDKSYAVGNVRSNGDAGGLIASIRGTTIITDSYYRDSGDYIRARFKRWF